MKIEFDIRLKASDLFHFNMRQTYSGMSGWLSIIIAILMGIMAYTSYTTGDYTYIAIYIVAGIVILVYNPITLWTRCQKTIQKNESLANTLHYQISEESIHVKQGDQEADLPWKQVYRIIGTSGSVLIYSSRVNAYVIPRDQLGDRYDALKQIAQKALPAFRFKMK